MRRERHDPGKPPKPRTLDDGTARVTVPLTAEELDRMLDGKVPLKTTRLKLLTALQLIDPDLADAHG